MIFRGIRCVTIPTTDAVPFIVDLDSGGKKDMLLGAADWNVYYFRNQRLDASADYGGEPAVVWLRSTFAEEGPGRFDAYFDYFAPGDGEKLRADFHDGAKGHAFWHELDRFDTDLVISKNRFSAFIERTSELDQQLHALGIDTLVVTGTLTNVCCESTVRDAMMLDYKCILIEDANAAQSDEEHLAALANVARVYGDVLTTTEFLNKFAR